MSENIREEIIDNSLGDNSGLSPPMGEVKTSKKPQKKELHKTDKSKKRKKEKSFTPNDLEDLRNKLDKKERGFLHNLGTKRYTKKITRGIILERLIGISLIMIFLTMGVVYSVSYTYVNSGYGINVVSDQQITKAVSLSDDDNFERLSVGLKASAITSLDNISYSWLPPDLDNLGGGSHNGENYICYTFYVLNTGNADLTYASTLRIRNSTQNVETAIRIQIFTNGVPTVYTHTYEEKIDSDIDGEDYTDENANGVWDETEPYVDENLNGSFDSGVPVQEFYSDQVLVYNVMDLAIGSFNKYTVVIWLEGEDDDCLNDKFSSELQLVWNISVLEEEVDDV